MIKACSLFFLFFILSTTAMGASKSSISRGGFGFLYADTNHFNNPGLFSQLRGFSFSGEFEKDQDESTVVGHSSMVAGNGRVGFGAFAQRSGFDLTDKELTTDSAGTGFGFNFAKNRAMVGVGYQRSVDQYAPSDGTVSGTFTYQPTGKGLSIGAGYGMTINADVDTKSVVGALGYAFNPMVQVEGTYTINNLDNRGDSLIGGFMNVTGRFLYATGGFTYDVGTLAKTAMARVGFVLGNTVDISGFGSKVFETGSEYSFGGVFRLRL